LPEVLPDTSPELEIPGTVTVNSFEINGSTVFSEEELAAVTQSFTNRPITFSELLQARSAVTQLYIDAGYVTSGAFIPAGQPLSDGIVEIQVIEGYLEAIKVMGTKRLRPDYVRSRLRLAAGKPLNLPDLLSGLQLLQVDPLIENLSAELTAGNQTGSNILVVQATPADTLSVQLGLDNGRSPSVGTTRLQGQVIQDNVLGFGDSLSIGQSRTDGSITNDVSYTFPFNPRNGTLKFLYSDSDSEIIEPPFDDLGIESDSRTWEFSIRQPLHQTVREEFALGLTLSNRFSETSFVTPTGERIGFPSSAGANQDGRTRLTALRFSQEWLQRQPKEVIALRSQFNLGLPWFDATINSGDIPDSKFFSWQGQAQWVRLLGQDSLLLAKLSTQLADRSLLSLERFGLGGQGSVRGYRQDQLLTDNGVFASVESRFPIARVPEWDSVVQIAPFIDLGIGWNDDVDPSPNELISVGAGLMLQVSDRLTMRLDYGIPLVDVDDRDRTFQENGFLFSINGRLL
jgi:hemolysin activation/secretion protein